MACYSSRVKPNFRPLLLIAAFVTHDAVRAQDGPQTQAREWPRFHIGVGAASVGSDLTLNVSDAGGIPAQIGQNTEVDSGTAQKAVAGFRPLRVVGVELEYLDLGDGSARSRVGGGQVPSQYLQVNGSSEAWVVSALLFIPERAASVDVYAKVGVADLEESLRASGYTTLLPGCLPAFPNCAFDTRVKKSDASPYVGFGARFKIARFVGFRVEYEAIDRDGRDAATLLSLGIAAEF
jgi:hypothetical protein